MLDTPRASLDATRKAGGRVPEEDASVILAYMAEDNAFVSGKPSGETPAAAQTYCRRSNWIDLAPHAHRKRRQKPSSARYPSYSQTMLGPSIASYQASLAGRMIWHIL